ncbi:AAC(3) family N-acetyltransferase [Erysipelothrix anatis]|uniref:AAC(3) family N-acetyltransferase n=1 Tax=Erysipelothrix anatis TaxID=2683713 RepID=UPI001357ABCC|nr:AAC(3) family N-acetyltransferase [Erysipelothrix anatis]
MEQKVNQDQIQSLLKRLDVPSDGVLIIHENSNVPALVSKYVLDMLLKNIEDRTVSIIGDNTFNNNVSQKVLKPLVTTQERIILSSGRMLQLMLLKDETTFAHHPSLMIGHIGKYAKFFARHVKVDYPYGDKSIFQDMYELNATILFLGEPAHVPEAKLAYAHDTTKSIKRNTAIKDGEMISFLDIDIDETPLLSKIVNSNILLFEEIEGVKIYGISYRMLVDFITM